ncbi:MAG: hypothetical protein B7Z68_07155 [Acidobacteria bacterium 21-70-11]|nr:MAG: hypothetical protein B7Z68_07155 [Acidobacteria bacterium 21-70-11]
MGKARPGEQGARGGGDDGARAGHSEPEAALPTRREGGPYGRQDQHGKTEVTRVARLGAEVRPGRPGGAPLRFERRRDQVPPGVDRRRRLRPRLGGAGLPTGAVEPNPREHDGANDDGRGQRRAPGPDSSVRAGTEGHSSGRQRHERDRRAAACGEDEERGCERHDPPAARKRGEDQCERQRAERQRRPAPAEPGPGRSSGERVRGGADGRGPLGEAHRAQRPPGPE